MLLLLERFQQAVELQPIKKNKNKNEKEDLPSTKTLDCKTSSAVEQSELHASDELKDSTLLEEIMQVNQKEDSYNNIKAYLEDSKVYAKPYNIKIKGCKTSEGLLMKRIQLWMPNNEGLWLKVIKEIYTQPAVGHPGIEQTLNMIQRHYH